MCIDLGIDNDPISFSEAIDGDNFDEWLDVMKDELKSMTQIDVWDLMELLEGCKRVECKWVFKTKHDSHENIEYYKVQLVAKGFTKKMALIIRKHLHLLLRKILLELSWH